MLWRTHIRIANEVLYKLEISKSSPEADSLREGIIAPDKWKDFPHHHSKEREIEKHIMNARKFFLHDNLENAFFHLGVALHYIQDSYVSLSTRSTHHTHWEEQIDDAYFTDNLYRLAEKAFHNRPDRREEYLEIAEKLSRKIDGKEATLKIATMPGPGISFWSYRAWGKPHVDLNFALKASFLISKAVLSQKKYPELQEQLKNVYVEYERMLKEAEIKYVNSILESLRKEVTWKNRKQKNGLLQKIKNSFFTSLSKKHEFDVNRKLGKYTQKKHLMEVREIFENTIKMIVAPHQLWYHFDVPKMDVDSVESDLLSVNEASDCLGISESSLQRRIAESKIFCYHIKNREFIRRSELKQMGKAQRE